MFIEILNKLKWLINISNNIQQDKYQHTRQHIHGPFGKGFKESGTKTLNLKNPIKRKTIKNLGVQHQKNFNNYQATSIQQQAIKTILKSLFLNSHS